MLGTLVAALLPQFTVAQLTAREEELVGNGDVVVHVERSNHPVKRFLVVGTIDRPIDEVWAAYTDFGHYDRIFDISRSEVRKREGNTLTGYFGLELFWPLAPRWTLNETIMDRDHWQFSFRRIQGTFKYYEGDLELTPLGARKTLVRYGARIDPDFAMIPTWVFDTVQFQLAPGAITHMREWMRRQDSDRQRG